MINLNKVANDIKSDGKYDAILDIAKIALCEKEPSFKNILKLLKEDSFYIKEYKDLNRWGELSSVHVQELNILDEETEHSKETKNKINSKLPYLINGEEYEIQSKKIIYLSWTFFIALPSIYVIDNLVRVSTDLYTTNEDHVYISFLIVLLISAWGYFKVVNNHKKQHLKYIQTQKEVRELVKDGLENKYFLHEDIYIK